MGLGILNQALLCLVILGSVAWGRSNLPQLDGSAECAATYLLLVQESAPYVFEEGAEYDIDMMAFIEQNRQLIDYLKQSPEFRELERKQSPRIRITINHNGTATPKSRNNEVSSDLLMNLTSQVQANWPRYRAYIKQQPQFYWNQLVSITGNYPVPLVRPMVLALLNQFHSKAKKEVLGKKDLPSVVSELLTYELDHSQFISSFRFESYHIHPNQFPSIEHVTANLQSYLNIEANLVQMVILAYGLGHSTRFSNHSELVETAVDEINANPEAALAANSELGKLSHQTRTQIASVWQGYFGLSAKPTSKKSDQPAQIQQVSTQYSLVEVPGFLAAFRGLVGGDCASQYCFGYSYLPAERTFFLYDDANQLMGYAMLTELESNDGSRFKKSWYLHDITGRRLSVPSAKILIHALSVAAKSSGRLLLLPSAESIGEINNHLPLIQLQQQLVEHSKKRSLKYSDSVVRDNLSLSGIKFDARYDVSSANPFGYEPELSSDLLSQITVGVDETSELAVTGRRPQLSAESALILSLSLLTSERMSVSQSAAKADLAAIVAGGIGVNAAEVDYSLRKKVAKEIASLGNHSFVDVQQLSQALANKKKYPLELYYQRVAEQLKGFGIRDAESILQKHPYLLYEGHLRSANALSTKVSKWKKATIDFTVNMLRRWPNPKLAFEVIADEPKVFEASERFQNTVRALLQRHSENGSKFDALKEAGVEFGFLTSGERALLGF